MGGMGLGERGKRVNGERRREGSSIKRGSEWRVGEGEGGRGRANGERERKRERESEWREEEGGEHDKDREGRE